MLRPEKGYTQPDRLAVSWSVQGAKEDGAKKEKDLMIFPLVSRKKTPHQYNFWYPLEAISRNNKNLGPP